MFDNFKYHKNKNLQNENYELNLEQFIVFLLLSKLYGRYVTGKNLYS